MWLGISGVRGIYVIVRSCYERGGEHVQLIFVVSADKFRVVSDLFVIFFYTNVGSFQVEACRIFQTNVEESVYGGSLTGTGVQCPVILN